MNFLNEVIGMEKGKDTERKSMHEHRADYAISKFESEDIRYMRPDENSDRFFVWSKDNTRKYTFFAGTGLILGPYDQRGIENMVMIAKGEKE